MVILRQLKVTESQINVGVAICSPDQVRSHSYVFHQIALTVLVTTMPHSHDWKVEMRMAGVGLLVVPKLLVEFG